MSTPEPALAVCTGTLPRRPLAEYDPADRPTAGGGAAGETENIEVLEIDFDDALAMVASGAIVDAKTILLLYHARLKEIL